jgi:hypothetical protein
LTLNVTWRPVLAANGSPSTGAVPPIYIWTLSHYTINGSAITGTTRTCGNQAPPLALNATGAVAIGVPTTTIVNVLDQTPTTTVWDHDTRTAATTGILGGWNVGSSMTNNPTTSIAGLAATSMYSDPATAWPQSGMTIPVSDLVDDDMDGNPGITEYPLNDISANYYLPATELGGTGAAPPTLADKLYVVSRTEVSFYGVSTSCTEATGTVSVPEYNVHVIGCHDQGGSDCTAAEWEFVDSNVTVYSGSGGANSLIGGTFDTRRLSAEGGLPTCDDVVAAFPSPMPQP